MMCVYSTMVYLFLLYMIPVSRSVETSSETGVLTVEALTGGTANLPCNIIFVEGETNASLVLWYKEGSRHPLYSIDGRDIDIFSVEPLVPENLKERLSFDLLRVPPTLRIFSITKEDSGLYNCRVDYKRSRTVYHRVKLIVIDLPGRPVIKDKFGEVVPEIAGPYNEGEPLALICESEGGNPLPKLQWFKKSEVIDSSDRILRGGVIRNELLLGSLLRTFHGNKLACEARNTNLTDGVRTEIRLDINLKPTDLLMEKLPTLVAGKAKLIWCNVTGARPNVVVSWFLDSQKLKKTEHSDDTETVSSSLKFTPIATDHGRQLTCKAHNPSIENSEIEDSQILKVYYVPRISLSYELQNSDNLEISEGDDVMLYCTVLSNPPILSLTWLFNGTEIKTDSITGKTENLTYLLSNVSFKNTGVYNCKAKNSMGEYQSKDILIQIRHPPRCRRQMKVSQVQLNPYKIDIQCEVAAYPSSVSFNWWLEKRPNSEKVTLESIKTISTISVATVTREMLLQFDRILCSAENISGKQKRPCVLKINSNDPPNAPSNCSIIHATSKDVYIRCNIDESLGMRQLYHMEIYNSDSMRLIENVTSNLPLLNASDLPTNTNLRIKLYNTNSKGRSESIYMKYSTNNRIVLTDDAEDNLMEDKPIAAILTGMVAGIFMVLCIILILIKLRRNCRSCQKGDDPNNISSRKTDKSSSEEMCSSKDGQSPDLIPLHKSLIKVDEKPIFIIESEHSIKNDIDGRNYTDIDRYEESVRKKPDGQESYLIEELVEEPRTVLGPGYGHCCGFASSGDRPTTTATASAAVPILNHNNHHHEDTDNIPDCLECDIQGSYHIKCSGGNSSTALPSPSRRYKLESSV